MHKKAFKKLDRHAENRIKKAREKEKPVYESEQERYDFLRLLKQTLYTMEQKDADEIASVLRKLQLPLPRAEDQARLGYDGLLIFLNEYGIAVKIENGEKYACSVRINNEPEILKPLASIRAGDYIIELCPGCEIYTGGGIEVDNLKAGLKKKGYDFWDAGARNLGYLPVKNLPEDPKGFLVIIDRLSIQFGAGARDNRLEILMPKFHPQDVLHGPLIEKFRQAWPNRSARVDAEKMAEFWQMCCQFREEGKLVSGWEKYRGPEYGDARTARSPQFIAHSVAVLADNYQRLMEEHKRKNDRISARQKRIAAPKSNKP